MFSIAKREYELTANTDERSFFKRKGAVEDIVGFCPVTHDNMRRESCIVGMLMAWTVVALESIINHAIAETLDDREKAAEAIRFPQRFTNKQGLNLAQTDLSKKLFVLTGKPENVQMMKVANELCWTRNEIVHDKPFSLDTYGDGEPIYFRTEKDESRSKYFHFDDLSKFFEDCDQIKDFIKLHASDRFSDADFSFSDLNKDG